MLVKISRTSQMKSKDFQKPDLFSRTFQALKMRERNFRTFRDFQTLNACTKFCR